MTKAKLQNISIIGDGGWGTTLAILLARKGYPVKLWGAFPEYVRQVKETRINRKFLPGIEIPHSVEITDDLGNAVEEAAVLVLAVPSQYLRSVLAKLQKYKLKDKLVLSVVKGIETRSLMRMSELVRSVLGPVNFAVLSGPTIAGEVAKGVPSTAVIAAKKDSTAKTLQEIFNTETFRIYRNTDITGVEVAGSLKNVIAIACGVCDGLGYGTNTKAAILARGLAEMARLGRAMGAKPQTFSGLAGLGDLVTTSMNPASRNRTVGEHLGKGYTIEQVLESMSMVAEGVETAKAAYALSKKYKVAMPITTEVYNIIFKRKPPQKAVIDLMSRETRAE